MTEQAAETHDDQSSDDASTETATTADAVSTESTEPQEGDGDAWNPERAKEKIRKINSENRSLRERATEAEKKAASVEELQTRTATLDSENLRLRVGYELGLPYNLAVRLQGSNRDELVADAETLVDLVSPVVKATPQPGRPVASLKPGATPERVDNDEAEYQAYAARHNRQIR